MIKICNKCNQSNPATTEFFYKKKSSRDGLQKACKKCISAQMLVFYKENNEKVKQKNRDHWRDNKELMRERRLLKEYGMNQSDYNQMFMDQRGCCAICEEHQSNFKKTLAVDHDHANGKVRGLLCDGCNMGIGKLKDSIDLLNKASAYLSKQPAIEACVMRCMSKE